MPKPGAAHASMTSTPPPHDDPPPRLAGGGAALSDIVQATFWSAPDGLVVIDAQGDLVICNDRFLALWAFPPDMLARRDTRELRLHTATRIRNGEAFLRSIPEMLARRHPGEFDEVVLKDGRVFQRLVSPLDLPDRPGLMIVRWRDVTDERRAQEQVGVLSAQMTLAMAHAEIVFWEADLVEGRFVSDTGPWMSSLGYEVPASGPTLRDWEMLVHPDDRASRATAWQAHVSGLAPTFEAEFRIRRRDGRWLWVLTRGVATARDAQGQATRVVGLRVDITRRRQAELQLEAQAFTDGLTGSLNRRRFLELASVEMSRARRHGHDATLLMIDLDHFKALNDTHGHAGGDLVLRAFVTTAAQVTRASDLFGRVGGEEFALLLPQTSQAGGLQLAHRLQALVRASPVMLGQQPVHYSASIGVAAWSPAGAGEATIELLMLAADNALYKAKHLGRSRVELAAAGTTR